MIQDQSPHQFPTDAAVAGLLTDFVPRQRWFAAKNLDRGPFTILSRTPMPDQVHGGPIEQLLFSVQTPVGVQRYQMWIGWSRNLPDSVGPQAHVGDLDGWTAYDALQDPHVAGVLLAAIAGNADVGELEFRSEPGVTVDTALPGLVIGAEQSNTSIVYGQQAILKMFRRLEPGPNPDAEIHRALSAAGSQHVARPLGEIVGPLAGRPTTLGLLTEFFANSAEGWAMATASVRDLLSEGDLTADEVGGDFAAEADRLGQAVAEVHADLAAAFGSEAADPGEARRIIEQMIAGAEAAIALVPELAEHRESILATFGRAADHSAGLTLQRIHGDLHLGQELRTPTGWLVIDFEGEPSKSLADRVRPDSPMRDVAAMLRSFDYAAFHQLSEWEQSADDPDPQLERRAQEWADRNRSAFCDGYAEVTGTDPRDAPELLRAYELDKAVYEVLYETRNRPSWVSIPLRSMRRLLTPAGRGER